MVGWRFRDLFGLISLASAGVGLRGSDDLGEVIMSVAWLEGGGVHGPYCHSRAHIGTARADQPPWELEWMDAATSGDVMASYHAPVV